MAEQLPSPDQQFQSQSNLESLPPEQILSKARDVDYYDRVSRRTFVLDLSQPLSNCPVNFAVLTNQAAIQIVDRPA